EDKVTGKMLEIRPDQKVRMTGCMIQHNLKNHLIKKRATRAKAKLHYGNFIGGVKSINPDIIGRTNAIEDDIKNIQDPSNVVYVNNMFSPLRSTLNQQFPNIELFFRIDDTGFLPLLASKLGYTVTINHDLTNEYSSIIPHNSNQLFTEHTKTAFVPISTGCSQFCSYCIVPYSRGLEKNRPLDEIISEVKHHLDHGIQEIVLLGQIVNKHPDFVSICKTILTLPGLKRLRYTSPYPTFFSDELLKLHTNEPAMCPHIHMPLQSGSDHMLRKMFRGYTASDYRTFVDKIRSIDRPISITSDIIVGHPDETEHDFQDSLDMITYAQFDMIYIGIYSPRPGTLGAKKYEDNIPMKVKKARWSEMNDLLRSLSLKNNQQDRDTIKEVMVTRQLKNGSFFGYTDSMKNIIIESSNRINKDMIGNIIHCKILGAEAFKLFGECC
ncbi:MAG TPA: MiaB/RimO family radical SAM methylthiotransferase, partial [Candidatus Absconditabacterales bacterium]|nr:MiaB/RimO family radical SAM methylthiotransferase [Candidatus Absconditabacterales bacterium]